MSVASLMATVAVLATAFNAQSDVMIVLIFVVAIVFSALVGLINGWLVTGRGVSPFLATLAMMILLQGLRFSYTQGAPSGSLPPGFRVLGAGNVVGIPINLMAALALAVLLWLILHRGVFGRRVRIVGGSPRAATLVGVSADRVTIGCYVICSVMAGIGGLFLVGFVGTIDNWVGRGYELDSIVAAVMGGVALSGGRGSIAGALLGALNPGDDLQCHRHHGAARARTVRGQRHRDHRCGGDLCQLGGSAPLANIEFGAPGFALDGILMPRSAITRRIGSDRKTPPPFRSPTFTGAVAATHPGITEKIMHCRDDLKMVPGTYRRTCEIVGDLHPGPDRLPGRPLQLPHVVPTPRSRTKLQREDHRNPGDASARENWPPRQQRPSKALFRICTRHSVLAPYFTKAGEGLVRFRVLAKFWWHGASAAIRAYCYGRPPAAALESR